MHRKKISFIFLFCILSLLISQITYAGSKKTKNFGDWKLWIKTDSFGETSAYLEHDSTPDLSILIKCEERGKYSMELHHPVSSGWTNNFIEVKYKIGTTGAIKTEEWYHFRNSNLTILDDATSFVESMKAAPGRLALKAWYKEFNPSLMGFTKAINELDKYCKN